MPTALDTRLVALHQLRLKGVATTEAVATGAGLPADEAADTLRRLQGDGLADERLGRVPGFCLTADGRAVHAVAIRDELAASSRAAAVEHGYRAFLRWNGELVAACTAWQVRDLATGAWNDHADAGYDAAVTARLERVHAAAVPVCADLAAALPRFGPYARRLGAALDHVRAGRHEWFARPIIDSYHTVWMELHEDLLVTLGIERSSETAP